MFRRRSDRNLRCSKRIIKFEIQKKRRNQTWRDCREDKKMFNLGNMIEEGYKTFKCSSESKKGPNYRMTQGGGPKKLEDSLAAKMRFLRRK